MATSIGSFSLETGTPFQNRAKPRRRPSGSLSIRAAVQSTGESGNRTLTALRVSECVADHQAGIGVALPTLSILELRAPRFHLTAASSAGAGTAIQSLRPASASSGELLEFHARLARICMPVQKVLQ